MEAIDIHDSYWRWQYDSYTAFIHSVIRFTHANITHNTHTFSVHPEQNLSFYHFFYSFHFITSFCSLRGCTLYECVLCVRVCVSEWESRERFGRRNCFWQWEIMCNIIQNGSSRNAYNSFVVVLFFSLSLFFHFILFSSLFTCSQFHRRSRKISSVCYGIKFANRKLEQCYICSQASVFNSLFRRVCGFGGCDWLRAHKIWNELVCVWLTFNFFLTST